MSVLVPAYQLCYTFSRSASLGAALLCIPLRYRIEESVL